MLSVSTNIQVTGYKTSWKIQCFHFFSLKSLCNQNWPCHKIGQGHDFYKLWWARVPDPTHQVSLKSVHQFQRRRFFLWFLPYIGMAAILVMWPGPFISTFVPPSYGCSKWSLALIGQAVSEKKIFEIVDDGRRRTDAGPWPSYKLTLWAFGSGELTTEATSRHDHSLLKGHKAKDRQSMTTYTENLVFLA